MTEALSIQRALIDPAAYAATDEVGVTSLSGVWIDTSGPEWRVGASSVVNWDRLPALPAQVERAFRDYIKHHIRTNSPKTTETEFDWFVSICNRFPPTEEHFDTETGDLPQGYFEKLKRALEHAESLSAGQALDALGAFRRFYLWASDASYAGFCPDAAIALEDKIIGQHAVGTAVLRSDSQEGPLDDVEYTSLVRSIQAAVMTPERRTVSLRDAVAVVLCMSFGLYPQHLYWVNEDDYFVDVLPDGSTRHFLKVPRIKKGAAIPREQWKLRELDQAYGELVKDVIEQNAQMRSSDPMWDEEKYDKALFHGAYSARIAQSPFVRDTYRIALPQLSVYVGRLARRVGVLGRDGKPLDLTARRLRYTYATRLVSAGAAPRDVAEALDHSSIQHVMIYFDGRQRMLRRIEKKVGLELAATAKLFHGEVVKSEEEAPRGADTKSRIPWVDRQGGKFVTLGNCGKFDYCGLARPKACYTCALFRPWLDGPHETILQELVAERDEKESKGIPKQITGILDEIIVAVCQVILACEAMRGEAFTEAAQ